MAGVMVGGLAETSIADKLRLQIDLADGCSAWFSPVVSVGLRSMTPERWLQIEKIYDEARQLGPAERATFLRRACADDEELRREIERLLADVNRPGTLLSTLARNPAPEKGSLVAELKIIAEQISHFRIISPLGAGGMGEVWLARDIRLERLVALKLLHRGLVQETDRLNRFAREAKAASTLNHPNIITIYEIGRIGETHFIATEYIEGLTLREIIRQRTLSIRETLHLSMQIATALEAAHRAGIVHRDIKPANIMVRPDQLVKVLDFGLARILEPDSGGQNDHLQADIHTQSGLILGTPKYMSPEQARGKKVDARTDVYSLGVVMYEMIAGTPPFKGETMADQLAAIIEKTPLPLSTHDPDISPEFEQLIHRAMSKDVADRYQSAGELLADLRREDERLRLSKDADEGRIAAADRRPVITEKNRQAKTVAGSAGLERPSRWRSLFPVIALLSIPLVMIGIYFGLNQLAGWRPFAQHLPQPSKEAVPWYEIGTQALRDGSYYQASQFLGEAVRRDPKFLLARARLAEAFSELDYTDSAQEQLLQVSLQVPDRSQLSPLDRLTLEAILNTVTRNLPAAITNYLEMERLASAAEKPRIRLDLGRAYEHNHEPAKAIESYLRALQADPQLATAHLRLGVVYGVREKDLSKAEASFAQAEDLYRKANNKEGLAEVFFNRGILYSALSRLAESRRQLDQVSALGNEHQTIRALFYQSRNSLDAGQIEQARGEAEKGYNQALKNNMKDVVTQGLASLGEVYLVRGDYVKAKDYYTQSIQSARAYNGRYNVALGEVNLGSLLISQGRLDEGLREVESAQAFFKVAGYRNEELRSLLISGRAKRLKGDYAAARSAYDQLLPLARQSGDEALVALVHSELSQLLIYQERYPEAIPHNDESYRINQSLGLKSSLPYALLRRSSLSWLLGDYQTARAALREAASVADQHSLEAEFLLRESEIALSEQNFQEAIKKSKESLAKTEAGAPQMRIQTLQILGLAETLSGSVQRGLSSCLESLKLARGQKDDRQTADALLALAEAQSIKQDWKESLVAGREAQELCAKLGRLESEWRAWLLIASSNRGQGLAVEAREAALQASEKRNRLQQQWGAEAFNRYLSRPDIGRRSARLNELLSEK
jgi:serine/threonine protein kinase/Tfp pilus assembly protein PilF